MQTNEDPKATKNGLGIAALSAEKVKNPIGSITHEGNAIAKAWSHIADVTPPDCRKTQGEHERASATRIPIVAGGVYGEHER